MGDLESTIAELIRDGKPRDQAIAIAYDLSKGTSKALTATIVKSGEKQIAMAVTNVVADKDGTPVVDHQGDVMSISNLEDSFIKAWSKGGVDAGGAMHDQPGGADVVQFMTISREEWAALEPYRGMEIGVVKIRVRDPKLWAGVKDGTYPEVSIGGDGTRERIE